jgi:transcriptional regulator with XRE-family HTH domain
MKRSANLRPMESAEELAADDARWAALGRHVHDLRYERRWGQEDLAEASGVSVPTIRAIENHKKGRRHTPRTLTKLSEGFGLQDDYLGNYLLNPAPAEPGTTKTALPPRSVLDQVVGQLDGIIVQRLNEIVVPRLENVEKQVRKLADVFYKTGLEVETYREHPGDAE